MNKQVVKSNDAPAAIGPYSQAIQAGAFLFISGQIPIDPQTGTLASGSIESETHRVMKNIDAILRAANLDFENVVKASIFLKSMDDFASVNTVYSSYFKKDFPARETIEVSRLPKDARVEISVIAAVS